MQLRTISSYERFASVWPSLLVMEASLNLPQMPYRWKFWMEIWSNRVHFCRATAMQSSALKFALTLPLPRMNMSCWGVSGGYILPRISMNRSTLVLAVHFSSALSSSM